MKQTIEIWAHNSLRHHNCFVGRTVGFDGLCSHDFVFSFLIREVFFLLSGASGSEDRLRENIVNEWTDGWMGSEQSCGFNFLIMLVGIFKQCIWKGI